ncbi:cobalamin-binding protein [Halopseudomonas sabulinigri]|uniref:Cobalamin-binding protein n=1 Tax=Halopseudomonas sabulinigri TaxID=472181 RepID=A0A1H1VD04_9GAMM|nr:cobalamin-binding protein [Halopseudomonas sabulinigri]SDS82615.1 iron complex transport system substrate-binding protein/vitamin B12 transport system substrate-binding protein [Halopseudomonas sabulinigri]
MLPRRRICLWAALLACLFALPAQAAAQRIVSLAPFLTDMVQLLDAGDRLVGVLDDGQLPPELAQVPRVGAYQTLSAESIVAQRPDLVLAWTSGNSPALLQRLRSWHIQVVEFDPQSLADIASATQALGELLGQDTQAEQVLSDYHQQLQSLAPPAGQRPQRVFIQLWDNPLYTVAGGQLVSDALQHCGAQNVFAKLPGLAPQVGREGVLAANPDIIIALADQAISAQPWLDDWRRFPQLKAVADERLYVLASDQLVRPTPRVVEGVAKLCALVTAPR